MPPPNIILLTIDCWRADHLNQEQTPNLYRLAQESCQFTQAYSCGGWTRPAMDALMTSSYHSMSLAGKATHFVSESLQTADYETIGVTTNINCSALNNFDRGFDVFEHLRPYFQRYLSYQLQRFKWFNRAMRNQRIHKLLNCLGIKLPPPDYFYSAKIVVDHLLKAIATPRSKPLFMWAHFMDMHWPYLGTSRNHVSEELALMWRDRATYQPLYRSQGTMTVKAHARWQKLYAEETLAMDAEVGRLLAQLRQRDDWDNTVVIVTSDHGEEFYEHGTYFHSWNQMHDEGIRIPLLIRMPEQMGKVVSQLVSHIDLAPTLLDIARANQPESMQGQSLLPLLLGQQLGERPIYSEMMLHKNSVYYRLAIRSEHYKYIYNFEDEDDTRLYDLQADPQEMHNIADTQPEVLRQFEQLRLAHMSKGMLQASLESLNPQATINQPTEDLNPDVRRQLEALGYL